MIAHVRSGAFTSADRCSAWVPASLGAKVFDIFNFVLKHFWDTSFKVPCNPSNRANRVLSNGGGDSGVPNGLNYFCRGVPDVLNF